MASFSVKLPDLKPLQAALKKLPPKLAKKVFRQALRKGAKAIQAEAKRLAPVDTGLTRKAIKVRVGKRSRKPRIWVNTVVGKGDYKGDTFYAAFVEYGYRRGMRLSKRRIRLHGDDRPEVPARPFMRPAAEYAKGQAAAIVRAELATGIEREAAGLVK